MEGNVYASYRVELIRHLLAVAELGLKRVQGRCLSSSEAQLFAAYVTELTDVVRQLGPLQGELSRLRLAAVARACQSAPLRWRIGMRRQLTERENFFHERLEAEYFQTLLAKTATEEYHKGLQLEALSRVPQTVPEMAELTGLPVYTVSLRLNDLERSGMAEIDHHEGTTYWFKAAA